MNEKLLLPGDGAYLPPPKGNSPHERIAQLEGVIVKQARQQGETIKAVNEQARMIRAIMDSTGKAIDNHAAELRALRGYCESLLRALRETSTEVRTLTEARWNEICAQVRDEARVAANPPKETPK